MALSNFSQKISGDIWTDYNAHDPGVTILEQFTPETKEVLRPELLNH